MNQESASPAQSLLKGIFAVSLFLLLALSADSYKNISDINNSTRILERSYNARLEMVQLFSCLKDAESGQRGFIITRDSVFLGRYSGSLDRVRRSFENLKRLTDDRPQIHENLDSLKNLIGLRFLMLDSTLTENISPQKSKFQLIIRMARGKMAMDRNRAQIDRMIDLENVYLKECKKKYDSTFSRSPTLTLFFLLFSLAVFTVSYFNINRNLRELEAKNRALEKTVKELDSFNHMASHDLQEPLRKIQTILSRLSELEVANLSGPGKGYVEKIGLEATRMRTLIDDLLLFSSTGKAEKVFERTDLNELLENAKQELAQAIEAKNAAILSAHLPEIWAIPFQIRQLFINLIANSVKYARPGTAPVIQIDCAPALANDHPELPFAQGKKYLKISFEDNGTGFEQQFAEKIFGLFFRLRNADGLAGTGLGLAICKKIAENHGGFILAEGVPGVGATFTVFLPEK